MGVGLETPCEISDDVPGLDGRKGILGKFRTSKYSKSGYVEVFVLDKKENVSQMSESGSCFPEIMRC